MSGYAPVRAAPCDAGALLRRFFCDRHGVHDRGDLFFEGAPQAEHGRACRVRRLAEMIGTAGRMWGDEVHYWLHLHMDAHVADLASTPPHEEVLPDLCGVLMHVSMWHHRTASRMRASEVNGPLLALFCKIMPENGQPRRALVNQQGTQNVPIASNPHELSGLARARRPVRQGAEPLRAPGRGAQPGHAGRPALHLGGFAAG